MNTIQCDIDNLFKALNIKAKVDGIEHGLRTCSYFIKLEVGEKVAKIRSLTEELSLIIKSISEPKIRVSTATGHVVVEATTSNSPIAIDLATIIDASEAQNMHLPLVIGKSMNDKIFAMDLAECPHVLIGGTTGAGKSILSKTILYSLMFKYTKKELKLVLVDPKGTELKPFSESSFCAAYCNTIEQTQAIFEKLVAEMERRYQRLSQIKIEDLKLVPKENRPPFVCVVIDELADILLQDTKKKLYTNLVRLLQKARACGIHIIANTQRPSKEVVSGLIKSNMPVQIALRTANQYDSRIILGEDGAESLVGKGDMLVKYNGIITRVQGAIIV
jgi:S-DNA-T family DNA segregation ATPase FtsK/SpoIIIE